MAITVTITTKTKTTITWEWTTIISSITTITITTLTWEIWRTGWSPSALIIVFWYGWKFGLEQSIMMMITMMMRMRRTMMMTTMMMMMIHLVDDDLDEGLVHPLTWLMQGDTGSELEEIIITIIIIIITIAIYNIILYPTVRVYFKINVICHNVPLWNNIT